MQRDLRPIIKRALRVRPRGGVRHDQLTLLSCTDRVSVAWSARDTHPWDSHLSDGTRATLLLEQALEDTDVVIANLLRELPSEIAEIEISVVEPANHENVLVAGTIEREDAGFTNPSQSLRMRLKMLGIHFSGIVGGKLESLAPRAGEAVACA